uniref:Uncharacterized protein n=1 Tax=Sphaerodactylus townsendi TaxID=933632 RepID=A0ACB8GE98_9SAUR
MNYPPQPQPPQQQQYQQQQLAHSAAIRAEIGRFESVHPNIYSIYELLERVEEPALQSQIREHVIAIEGKPRPRPAPSQQPCEVDHGGGIEAFNLPVLQSLWWQLFLLTFREHKTGATLGNSATGEEPRVAC